MINHIGQKDGQTNKKVWKMLVLHDVDSFAQVIKTNIVILEQGKVLSINGMYLLRQVMSWFDICSLVI